MTKLNSKKEKKFKKIMKIMIKEVSPKIIEEED
jgi:hypothetical protein